LAASASAAASTAATGEERSLALAPRVRAGDGVQAGELARHGTRSGGLLNRVLGRDRIAVLLCIRRLGIRRRCRQLCAFAILALRLALRGSRGAFDLRRRLLRLTRRLLPRRFLLLGLRLVSRGFFLLLSKLPFLLFAPLRRSLGLRWGARGCTARRLGLRDVGIDGLVERLDEVGDRRQLCAARVFGSSAGLLLPVR
jgi:hypothetical protein